MRSIHAQIVTVKSFWMKNMCFVMIVTKWTIANHLRQCFTGQIANEKLLFQSNGNVMEISLQLAVTPKKSLAKAMVTKNVNSLSAKRKEHCKRYETYFINLLQCDIFTAHLLQTFLTFILALCYWSQIMILSHLFYKWKCSEIWYTSIIVVWYINLSLTANLL